jgi:II/X family phage/plasmid replication protein
VIDWLTFTAPLPHVGAIGAGQVMSISSDGEIEWCCTRRRTVEGSFSTGLQVRTSPRTVDPCTHVEISGNPVKFFQVHNLLGTDDLPSLVVATLDHVAVCLGITVTDETRAQWLAGAVQITRVDLTQSFHLGNRSDVLAWLRAAEQTAHLSHRGRGQLVKGSTLYFGKQSRRWSLKLYSKGQEITAKGHGQDAILRLPAAVAWADRTLRAELTLRGMELRRIGRASVADWLPVDGVPFEPLTLLADHLGAMTMTTARTLPDDVLASLSTGQRCAYLAWLSGVDLRQTMPDRSFYRLRRALLPHNIDVATLQPSEEAVTNVVPLGRVLEAKPVGVPDWAVGTPLYFEPRRVA